MAVETRVGYSLYSTPSECKAPLWLLSMAADVKRWCAKAAVDVYIVWFPPEEAGERKGVGRRWVYWCS